MSRDFYTLEELAQVLGRDRRIVEKMINRGLVPGRKVGGEWRFNTIEITHWLEQELRDLMMPDWLSWSNRSSRKSSESRQSPVCASRNMRGATGRQHKAFCSAGLNRTGGEDLAGLGPGRDSEAVKEREEVMSTGFENGVAIPHPRNPQPDALGQSIIAFGRTYSGIPFGAPKRALTDLFFLVLARDSATHLQILPGLVA